MAGLDAGVGLVGVRWTISAGLGRACSDWQTEVLDQRCKKVDMAESCMMNFQ